ncbi:MAG: Rsd/AlgQ family anti-sigma factor [Methylobacter sp.]|nr:Rsd/AlgQ family anti-sigma factor [Methylobacter sp.]
MSCHIAELIPFSANRAVRRKLARFSEILINYISLGHFSVCEYLLAGADKSDPALSVMRKIALALSASTEAAASFNDKYGSDAALILDNLKHDLSANKEIGSYHNPPG